MYHKNGLNNTIPKTPHNLQKLIFKVLASRLWTGRCVVGRPRVFNEPGCREPVYLAALLFRMTRLDYLRKFCAASRLENILLLAQLQNCT